MKRIKEFFWKLGQDNSGESIVIDEDKFKRNTSEKMMNENIRRYNKLLEEIETIRHEIKIQIPKYEAASKEFIMFVSIPKEREDDKEDEDNPEAKAKKNNPYINDMMLRKNEFEDKTRVLREIFEKIADLRRKEINKYFEAKRLINNNSIIIGENQSEIEIAAPEKTMDELNASNKVNTIKPPDREKITEITGKPEDIEDITDKNK